MQVHIIKRKSNLTQNYKVNETLVMNVNLEWKLKIKNVYKYKLF